MKESISLDNNNLDKQANLYLSDIFTILKSIKKKVKEFTLILPGSTKIKDQLKILKEIITLQEKKEEALNQWATFLSINSTTFQEQANLLLQKKLIEKDASYEYAFNLTSNELKDMQIQLINIRDKNDENLEEDPNEITKEAEIFKKISEETTVYVKSFIKKGETQLATNKLSFEEQTQIGLDMSKMHSEIFSTPIKNDMDRSIELLINTIRISKQNNMGNCGEGMQVGCGFVSTYYPKVNVEAYQVGNHVVLVIGRDPKSDPNNPETWRKSTYICDPWSEEDPVYPASEYKTRLKTYICIKGEDGRRINSTELFDESKHSFLPVRDFNLNYISKFGDSLSLLLAAEYGNTTQVELLLNNKEANIDLKYVSAALMLATEANHPEIVQLLEHKLEDNKTASIYSLNY